MNTIEDNKINSVICGDCEEVLRQYPSECIDLIMTSPPYANARKHVYGGVKHEQYVDWFLPKASEFMRVLKPVGSFVLNIKENVKNGERTPYVYELVLAMKEQGWKWTDDYIWHKSTSYPGKWPNRFRDAWEHCYHFTKEKKFSMYQDEVMIPSSTATLERVRRINPRDTYNALSSTSSGMGRNLTHWVGRTLAYPTNVIYISPNTHAHGHSAMFPEALPDWFIRLFTKEGDVVLDPFCGSGITLVAAAKRGRRYLGIDIVPEYCELSRSVLRKVELEQLRQEPTVSLDTL